MPYSPPWQEQDEDGGIQQERDRAQDYSWTDLFVGKKSGQIPPMGGDVLWTPNLDNFEYDPDIRPPQYSPPTGDGDEEEVLFEGGDTPIPPLAPGAPWVSVEYSFPEEEAICGDADETSIIGPGLAGDVLVDTIVYFGSDIAPPPETQTPYLGQMAGGSTMGDFTTRSPGDVPGVSSSSEGGQPSASYNGTSASGGGGSTSIDVGRNALSMAMNGDFGDLGIDFLKDTRPLSEIGTPSKSSVDGKKERTVSMSFSIPANKTNITLISYSYLDLSSINRRLGTNFSDQKIILGMSYEPLVAAGATKRKASLNEPSLNKSGMSSKNAGHRHQYVVNEDGNGNTMEACSPGGTCHSHKIVGGIVESAVGAQGAHKHAIRFKKGKKTTISDIRVKDFGSLKRIASVNVSPTSLQPDGELSPINEFAISHEDDGSLSFIFGLDVAAALKQSAFGSMFSKIKSTGVRKDIVSSALINSMEVIRRTAEGKEEVIASSSQKSSRQLLEGNIKTNRVRTLEDGEALGSISEINMGIDDIRTFTGKDLSPLYEEGVTYVVKIEMNDAVAIYLKSKLGALKLATASAKSWSSRLNSPKFSDGSRKTFSYSGSRAIKKEFKNKNTPVKNTLPLLAEIAGDIFGKYSPSEIIDICFPMVNSVTGNSQGTDSVISVMYSLSGRMSTALEGKISINSLHKTEKVSPPGFGSVESPGIQFEKEFESDYVSSIQAGTGNVFVKGRADTLGVNIVTKSDYEKRVQDEIDTYSSSEKASLPSDVSKNTKFSRSKLTSLTNLKSNMSSYLTPSSVIVGTEAVIDLSSVGSLWDEAEATVAVEAVSSKKQEATLGSSGLLGVLGITCEILGAGKDLGGVFAVDDDEVGILASDNKFSFQNIEEQAENVEDTGTSKEVEEISKALVPSLTLNLDPNYQDGTNMGDFDISKDESIFGSLSLSEVGALPIPLKSLFLSKSKDTKKDWLADETSASSFELSLKSIGRIEALSYEKDSNGNMSPKWKTLTTSRLRQVGKRSLRCRVVNYSNQQLGIENANNSILNSQFVIAGDNASSPRNFAKNSTVNRMKDYLLSLNKVVRDELPKVGKTGIQRRK
tara:strand:+ start:1839 stop:5111 length:3273 start_codon:yes stop_codon:yes gene_type:complete